MNATASAATPASPLLADLRARATAVAYHAAHAAAVVGCLAVHARHGIARRPDPDAPLGEAIAEGRRRYADLLARDLAAAEDGTYPRELLVPPVGRHLTRLPALLRQSAGIRARRDAGAWREVPADANPDQFPPYFRRTFHWQSDGYLSDRSAALYDVGVELLFLGTADVMRRAALPPILRELRRRGPGARVLDVACGTGRTLAMLAAAAPDAHLVGLDLSPWYVAAARRELGGVARASFLVAPAEDMPLREGWADVVTSTYLFHELPRAVRRQVARELARVVAPGGRVVVMDAAQRRDAPALGPALEQFPRDFHEPYFLDYLDDPLEDLLAEAGLHIEAQEDAYVSRLVVARRPG